MYKLTKGTSVIRLADAALIPGDEGNADYQCYLDWIEAGNTPDPIDPPTAEELRNKAKADRAAAVAAIVVTINGKAFNGDEESQTRMARAIIALDAAGQPETLWVLADNSATAVTRSELAQALAAAGAEQTRLWVLV